MIPSLAVEDLKSSLVQYLTTAFALADDDVHDVLEAFLNNEHTGVFRGPYLRVRPGFKRRPAPISTPWIGTRRRSSRSSIRSGRGFGCHRKGNGPSPRL